ncbi:hypothetical protein GCM10007989_28880 [Devosia pacifica]|uniref:Uncharacterized protein n=1 Tax=Devosia pacifica TaxID=1335967 RepID=A0A918VWZ6_9HYPH|nr:hypothetical protein [Devosia pacifica]GHA31158.1 hypothetical protein GCM10007989_28880 [Devosia pacifica]
MTDKAFGSALLPDVLSNSETATRGNRRNRILAALRAWLHRPRRPPGIPPELRRDLGLDPLPEQRTWHDIPINPSNLPRFRAGRL